MREVKIKPVTDEQVFYDKFLCDKFYLPKCTCVYATNFIWQLFFTGVNMSTSLLWQFGQQCNSTADNASAGQYQQMVRLLWQVFFVDPYRRTKFVLWQFFLWQVHLFKFISHMFLPYLRLQFAKLHFLPGAMQPHLPPPPFRLIRLSRFRGNLLEFNKGGQMRFCM
jgi:hypothetical protein